MQKRFCTHLRVIGRMASASIYNLASKLLAMLLAWLLDPAASNQRPLAAEPPPPSRSAPQCGLVRNSCTSEQGRPDRGAAMVRLTVDLIENSPQFMNPLKQRELDVRGACEPVFPARHPTSLPPGRRACPGAALRALLDLCCARPPRSPGRRLAGNKLSMIENLGATEVRVPLFAQQAASPPPPPPPPPAQPPPSAPLPPGPIRHDRRVRQRNLGGGEFPADEAAPLAALQQQ